MTDGPITAIILVRQHAGLTWCVRRSSKMANYPNLWSLPSIQYEPGTFADPLDIDRASELANALSEQRLGGTPVRVNRFLTEGSSNENPMGVDVKLRLYEVELAAEAVLNTHFYVGQEWMAPEGYQKASAGQPCGLCLRLWSNYAWLSGITDIPFVATTGEKI